MEVLMGKRCVVKRKEEADYDDGNENSEEEKGRDGKRKEEADYDDGNENSEEEK